SHLSSGARTLLVRGHCKTRRSRWFTAAYPSDGIVEEAMRRRRHDTDGNVEISGNHLKLGKSEPDEIRLGLNVYVERFPHAVLNHAHQLEHLGRHPSAAI